MLKDFFVKGLSARQIANFVAEWRARNGVANATMVDIVSCLNTGWIWTVRGQKKLDIQVLDDELLGSDDAVSISGKDSAVIKVKQSVWIAAKEAARSGKISAFAARTRFTLAHELGHVVLCHEKAPMARGSGVSASTPRPKSIPKYESAEWQANSFGALALVKIELLTREDAAKEVAARFGVSLQVATICLEQIPRKSTLIKNGFKELQNALSAKPRRYEQVKAPGDLDKFPLLAQLKDVSTLLSGTNSQNEAKDNNTDNQTLPSEMTHALCVRCKRGKIHQISGNRFQCEAKDCGYVGEILQDGDSYGT